MSLLLSVCGHLSVQGPKKLFFSLTVNHLYLNGHFDKMYHILLQQVLKVSEETAHLPLP